jgi:hypothetical protein
MAFIRTMKHESKRGKDGRVRQETIAYMGKGPSIEEAYQYWKGLASKAYHTGQDEIAEFRAVIYRNALEPYIGLWRSSSRKN